MADRAYGAAFTTPTARSASARAVPRIQTMWRRALLAVLGIGVICAAAAAALPDNEYQRWQLLAHTSQRRVLWLYQRLHYDPTPVDVALIGTSRMGAAVDVPRLARELAGAGRPATVLDLSLPESGRDLHWVLAQQLFATKRPKLLILGVIEQPARTGHPGFKYLAAGARRRRTGLFRQRQLSTQPDLSALSPAGAGLGVAAAGLVRSCPGLRS